MKAIEYISKRVISQQEIDNRFEELQNKIESVETELTDAVLELGEIVGGNENG